jgi:hypothetical protein
MEAEGEVVAAIEALRGQGLQTLRLFFFCNVHIKERSGT